MKLKRFFLGMLSLLVSIAVHAYDVYVDYIYYNLSGTQATVTHDGWNSYWGVVKIPQNITLSQTYEVTHIGERAFFSCDKLTRVDMPNSVVSIGSDAFSSNDLLQTILLSNSLQSIGDNAFAYCPDLIYVRANSEKSGVLPNNLVSIGNYAFRYCSKLQSITIPNKVTKIGIGAFYGCSSLTNVNISKSVTSIGDDAFNGCNSLKSVKVNWRTPISITKNVFKNRANATLYVPTGCKEAYEAAEYWKEFKTIVEFGPIVFADERVKTLCVNNWDTNGDGELDYDEVHAVTDLANVFKGKTKITRFNELQYFTRLVSIEDDAFSGCIELSSIIIPENVTTIGDFSFQNCSGLTYINIPSKVTSIGDNAFNGCSGLTSINIPSKVTSIGDNAFNGCSGLTSVTMNTSIPISITEGTFTNRSNATLYVPAGSKSAYEKSYYWKEFKTIKEFGAIPFADENVKAICVANWDTNGDGELDVREAEAVNNYDILFHDIPNPSYKFNDNEQITSFNEFRYFRYLAVLGDYAFTGCNHLKSVTIPENVSSIGINAFDSPVLTYVKVEATTPPSITSSTFCNRTNATLLVPSGCKTMYETADYWKDFKNIFEVGENNAIFFADKIVKELCVTYWDINGDGELNKAEATAIRDLGTVFRNRNITSFYELEYFKGLMSIGSEAFNGCSNLVAITIPNTVTSIGEEAFSNCSKMTSVTLHNGLMSIGYKAFNGCSSLTGINIPESVISIEKGAFMNCPGLESIIVENNNNTYDSRNNCNAIIKTSTNELISGCKNTTIPITVVAIGDYAFYDCICLSNILLPNSVSSIGVSAFSGCSGLTEITLPNSVTSIGNAAFYGCSGLSNITIPNSVTSIGNSAFSYCSGLSNITIPNSVTSISNSAFSYCSGLTKILLPLSVTSIGNSAFYGCSNLTEILLPNSVTSIGNAAFEDCSSLTEITLPKSVIGHSAFEGCSSLTEVNMPEGIRGINYDTFKNCSSLTSINIPNSVTSIGEYAFEGCISLSAIYIPEGVRYIPFNTFRGCSGLERIIVASNNTTYDSRNNCNAIIKTSTNELIKGCKNTIIPITVVAIGPYAFYKCSSLSNITIPNSVTVIDGYAFCGCSDLTSITIPSSVTSIGSSAFGLCDKLISVRVDIAIPLTLINFTFSNRLNATLYVPEGSKTAYEGANYWKDFKEIKETKSGDINGDKEINVGDIMSIIKMIVGTTQITDAADVNGDGNVNVGDIQAIINIIIANANNNARMMQPTNITNNDFLFVRKEDGIIGINLDNQFVYGAFQMKVTLPDEGRIESVEFNDDRLDGFAKFVRKTGDGQYFIIGYSMDGDIVEGSDGELFKIHTSGCANEDVVISDAIFSAPSSTAYDLPVIDNESTCVKNILTDKMWVEDNTIYINISHKQALNVFLFNGSLYKTLHLNNGLNSIILPQGQYIINNKKILIR